MTAVRREAASLPWRQHRHDTSPRRGRHACHPGTETAILPPERGRFDAATCFRMRRGGCTIVTIVRCRSGTTMGGGRSWCFDSWDVDKESGGTQLPQTRDPRSESYYS